MTRTPMLRWTAAAALVLAAPAVSANEGVHSGSDGIRSHDSLPHMTTTRADMAERHDFEKIAEQAEAATPPYCSGNKYGLGNGQGAEHGNGKPFSCGKSPG